jgi:hypothetical protein
LCEMPVSREIILARILTHWGNDNAVRRLIP